MIPIQFLRQFRLGEYAIFDLLAAFLGIYLLSPFLSKLLLKIKVKVPRQNWLFLTLPLGILAHLLARNITPMTKNFFDLSGHYFLKLLIIVLLWLGLRGIKILKAN